MTTAFSCARRAADPTNEFAACQNFCGDRTCLYAPDAKAHNFASPLGALRWKLRVAAGTTEMRTAHDVRNAVAAVLDAPEWTHAAEEINTLHTQLSHWKVFGEHAEGERSRMKAGHDRYEFAKTLEGQVVVMETLKNLGAEALDRALDDAMANEFPNLSANAKAVLMDVACYADGMTPDDDKRFNRNWDVK